MAHQHTGTQVPQIVVYGADCWLAKRFFSEQHIPYRWIDLDQDPQAVEYIRRLNSGKRIIPTIVFHDGSILVEPSYAELARKMGV